MQWRSSIKIFKRDFKQKEEKLNAEILTLKQQINKMREDNNKEENDLKRKKQQTDSFYADNINKYDEIMVKWRQDKKQLQVIKLTKG